MILIISYFILIRNKAKCLHKFNSRYMTFQGRVWIEAFKVAGWIGKGKGKPKRSEYYKMEKLLPRLLFSKPILHNTPETT